MKDLCVVLAIVFGRKTGLRSIVNVCFFFVYLRRKIQCGDCGKINVSVIYSLILTASYLIIPLSLITLKMASVSMQKKIFNIRCNRRASFFFLILWLQVQA